MERFLCTYVMKIKKGDSVQWKWAKSTAEGKVTSEIKARVVKKIKGSLITRNGTAADPVLEIRQPDGNKVLKLQHEVKKSKA